MANRSSAEVPDRVYAAFRHEWFLGSALVNFDRTDSRSAGTWRRNNVEMGHHLRAIDRDAEDALTRACGFADKTQSKYWARSTSEESKITFWPVKLGSLRFA